MGEHIDLAPAGQALLQTIAGVTDAQLELGTPCEGRSVGQLIQHLVGLTLAFRAAADKELGPLTDTAPDADGWPALEEGWRDALASRVPALVAAWRADSAWEGMTRAGGVDLPGEIAGLVALDEVVLHGSDLARATGQPYVLDDESVEGCMRFVAGFDTAGTPGLFGAAVDVGDHASPLEQLVARAGRDPEWSPGSSARG
jgi:uncharacterized protein (TIGR03086 family)